MRQLLFIAFVSVPPKADFETKISEQVVYLGSDPKKQDEGGASETRKGGQQIKLTETIGFPNGQLRFPSAGVCLGIGNCPSEGPKPGAFSH